MNFQSTFRRYSLVVIVLMFCFGANAATVTSTATGGDWSAGTTWVGGVAPAAGDDVVIVNGATVKLTADATILNFTINDGGIFDYDGWVLTIGGGGTVTPEFISQASGDWGVSATWLGSPTAPTASEDKVIICRDHTITSGSITLVTLIINSGGAYIDGNNNLEITSKFVLHGERQGTGTTTLLTGASLEGTGNHYSTKNLVIDGTVTIEAGTDIFIVADISMTGGSTVNNNGAIRATNIKDLGSATWWNLANSSLTTLEAIEPTLYASATGNTIILTKEANQNVKVPNANTYYNLVIGGSEDKTLTDDLTIDGSLFIYSNLLAATFNLNVRGNWINSGSFISGTGTVTFDGSLDQSITNASTETFNNLTISKALGGVLILDDDVIVSNVLTMVAGNINTGTNILTLTSTVGSLSHTSGSIIGSLERWIAGPALESPLFPVGTSSLYLPAQPSFTANSVGSLIVSFVEANPGNEGLSLDDDSVVPTVTVYNTFVEGYWDFTSANSFAPGNFNLDLTSTDMTSFAVDADTRILKRINDQSDWVAEGTHGTLSGDIVKRTGLTSLSAQYALADVTKGGCTPPVTYAITGDQEVVTDQTNETYSVSLTLGNTYFWSVTGGTINASSSSSGIDNAPYNEFIVDWGSIGQVGTVSVYETNACTQSEEVSLPVNVHALPTSAIFGSVQVTENQSGVTYSVESNAGYTYDWTIDGGLQSEGGNTNAIMVDWGESNVGSVSVVASYLGAPPYAETVSLSVDIYSNILSIDNGGINYWNDADTWDCACIPSVYQSVNIQAGHRVTLSGNETIQNITVAGDAVLDQDDKFLTIQGNLILNGVITGDGSFTLRFAGGAGLTIDGTGSINSPGESIDIMGEVSFASSADLLMLGDVTVDDKKIVRNYGKVALNTDMIGGANSIWINGAGSYLTTQGLLFTSTTGTLVASSAGNTVEYATTSGTGNIKTPLQSKYYNLVLSGFVDKTTLGDITILGDLTITSGILDLGTSGFDLTLEGNWVNRGSFSAGTQTVTFSGSGDQTISNQYLVETFYDLVINKSSGTIILDDEVIVLHDLSMIKGDIDASAKKITLGKVVPPENEGTLTYTDGIIIGEFERWLAASTTIDPLLFPIGTADSYRPMQPTFTNNNTGGTLTAKFVASNPGSNGLSANDTNPVTKRVFNTFVEGYWELTADGFDNVDPYNLELTGKDFTSYPLVDSTRLLIRDQASSAWVFEGAHVDVVDGTVIVKRAGMSTLSAQYALGSTMDCDPPAAPTFTGVTDVCKGVNGEVYSISNPEAGLTGYTWSVEGGSIAAGQGATSVTINWDNVAQIGSVGLSVTNACTVSEETLLAVNVHTMEPTFNDAQPLIVPENETDVAYSVENTTGYTYDWTIIGGTIASASGNSVTVDWGTTGIGQLSVTAQKSGCTVTNPVSIDVYKYVVIKSMTTGFWDVPASWDCSCVPGEGDNPMILSGHVILMNANVKVEHLNVISGGGLLANASGLTLEVTGNLTVDGGISVPSAANILNIQLTEGAGFDISGKGTITPGYLGTPGAFEVSQGSCRISTTAEITLEFADFTMKPAFISVDNYGSITLNQNLVSEDLSDNFTWLNQANSTLKLEGTLLTDGKLNASAIGNTVYYNASGAQNIKTPNANYHNLTIGGITTGTKTMLATTDVDGDLRITEAGILDANNLALSVAGDWTNSSSDIDAFLEGTGTVTLDGSTVQTISTNATSEDFYGLTLNNTLAGDAIVLAGDITISNAFTLTDGQIVNATNSITLDAGTDATVTVSAPTADSFVDGPLIHNISSTNPLTLIFPVGKGDELHLAELNVTNASATADPFTAEFFSSAPNSWTITGAIDHVSTLGYWDIDQGVGASVTTATVKLFYLASDAVDTPLDLRIVKDDLTNWVDLGGTGTAPTAGSILSTNPFTTFSEFALASISVDNPLPVTLLDFYAVADDTKVILRWATASELNNDFFTLEKSNNGKDFVKLGEVSGNGTTNLQMDYALTDHSPYLGLSYYRLSQTDYDGTTEVFPVVSVIFEGNKSFSISPNPILDSWMNLKISGKADYELLELKIIDLQGRLVERTHLKADYLGNVDTEIQLKKPLKHGVYIFELVSDQSKEYLKVVAN